MLLGLLLRIEIHVNLLPGELDSHLNLALSRLVFSVVNKLQNTWNGKRELLEEQNDEPLEARGSDVTGKRFQVSANMR